MAVVEIVPFVLWRRVPFASYAFTPMGDTGSSGLERDPVHSPAESEPARLRAALRSGSGPHRAAAVRAARPAPGLEGVLLEALGDPDPTVRVAAVHALPAVARARGTRG